MPLITLESIEDGGYAAVDATVHGEVESLVLHRSGQAVRAWLNVCPHAGRRLDWAPGKFLRSKDGLLVCAAHGASFEPADGLCVAGPCRGQSLRAVAVEVRDGAVFLTEDRGSVESF
jgi:nitrite reductase/ring-hydroxylating ferredoxin subunit